MDEFLSDYRDAVQDWPVLALQHEQDRLMMVIHKLRGHPKPGSILYALEQKLNILEELVVGKTELRIFQDT